MSNVAAGTDKKETTFAASGLTSGVISHLDLALRCTSTSDWKDFPTTFLRDRETAWPGVKASQNAAFKTAKQHGLANSRSSFFDLCWGDLQCQTLRPEPIKRRRLSNVAAGTDKKTRSPLQDLLRALFRTWTTILPLQGLLRALFRTWT